MPARAAPWPDETWSPLDGTGLRFLEQVEALIGRAAENPNLFPAVPGIDGEEARRGLVRRYGYWVIYETNPQALVGLSIWHGARRPEGWRTG